MNNLTLFKSSITNIPQLNSGKKMSFGKVILYIFFLSTILAIPVTKQVFSIAQNIKEDSQKITQKLPAFEIKNGKLITPPNTEGFIYQTNSIIFTFDPQGKRSASDVRSDLIGNAFGVAFLRDEFIIVLSSNNATESLLGSDQFSISYSNDLLDGLNQQSLKDFLNETGIPWWSLLIVFVVSLYPVFLGLIIHLLLISIGAILYSKMKLYSLRFLDCLKIVTYATTLPILLSSMIRFFNPAFDDSLLIIFVSLLFFFLATRQEERNTPTLSK